MLRMWHVSYTSYSSAHVACLVLHKHGAFHTPGAPQPLSVLSLRARASRLPPAPPAAAMVAVGATARQQQRRLGGDEEVRPHRLWSSWRWVAARVRRGSRARMQGTRRAGHTTHNAHGSKGRNICTREGQQHTRTSGPVVLLLLGGY